MVHALQLGKALWAHRSPAEGRIWISLDLEDLSILDVGEDSAASVIHASAIGLDDHLDTL